jgi:PleD family two-component response regulator
LFFIHLQFWIEFTLEEPGLQRALSAWKELAGIVLAVSINSSFLSQVIAVINPPRFPDILVLVADTSEFNRRIVRDALRVTGIKRFIDCPDGPSVVKSALRSPPSLMLLDTDIPLLPATECVRVLRKVPTLDIHTILITSRPSPELIEEARLLGIREILTKPVTHSGLWERVGTVVRTRIAPKRLLHRMAPEPEPDLAMAE